MNTSVKTFKDHIITQERLIRYIVIGVFLTGWASASGPGFISSCIAQENTVKSYEITDPNLSSGQGGRQGHPPQSGALTEAQQQVILEILSEYDPSGLTADDAKSIHRSFRDSGIRPGPGMAQVIESAGFDPQVLRRLDPPRHHPNGPGNRSGFNAENTDSEQM
ncbi:MAG: hypothetical protein D3926_23245 [Desulfobacteraceae bacterium]|nr:MAG: hypothetical protein D3926_23245 [Desulfobacteraceae bacterium]